MSRERVKKRYNIVTHPGGSVCRQSEVVLELRKGKDTIESYSQEEVGDVKLQAQWEGSAWKSKVESIDPQRHVHTCTALRRIH